MHRLQAACSRLPCRTDPEVWGHLWQEDAPPARSTIPTRRQAAAAEQRRSAASSPAVPPGRVRGGSGSVSGIRAALPERGVDHLAEAMLALHALAAVAVVATPAQHCADPMDEQQGALLQLDRGLIPDGWAAAGLPGAHAVSAGVVLFRNRPTCQSSISKPHCTQSGALAAAEHQADAARRQAGGAPPAATSGWGAMPANTFAPCQAADPLAAAFAELPHSCSAAERLPMVRSLGSV